LRKIAIGTLPCLWLIWPFLSRWGSGLTAFLRQTAFYNQKSNEQTRFEADCRCRKSRSLGPELESSHERRMRDLLNLISWMLVGLFRSRASLRAEHLALRHQLNVLHRRSAKRPVLSSFDRLVFICLYRIAPRILDAFTIVEPQTILRWHRAGFRMFWRWKSRRGVGRPKVPLEVRQLIREILGGLHHHYVRI
jgi:hypothetical protein